MIEKNSGKLILSRKKEVCSKEYFFHMDVQTGFGEKYLLYAILSMKHSKSGYLVWDSTA